MKLAKVNEFIARVRSVGPVVVAFDTLSGCMVGGDENAAKDMGLLVHGCQTVSRAFDCFVQVAHHKARKGNNERGHSSLRGAADIMVEIACKGHSVTVKCTKSKDSEPFATEQYTLTPHLNSAILKSLDALNKDQISILDTVDRYPGIKPKPLIEKTKVSQATVFRILRDFRAQELVTAVDSGCYSITDKGKKRLSTALSEPFNSEDGVELDFETD